MIKFQYIVIFFVLSLLTACGGGSSSSTTPTVEPPPPATTPPPTPTVKNTDTTGVITGFGSVFVNGVEYETTSAAVSTDDNDSASETDLQVGMVVSLKGSVNDDGKTGTAEAIHYEEQIKGPLDSIDLAANSLVVLGQTVIFDELTSLDNLVLMNLAPGDFLEISGFTNANGQLYATRMAKENNVSSLKVEGSISALDSVAKTFELANLVVDYNNATFVQITEQDLANNLMVRVKGDVTAVVNGVFTVNQIKAEQQEAQHNEGDGRHLEGVITVFDSGTSFVINGVNVTTNADTSYEHGTVDSLALNIRVKIKGTYDANGTLLAQEIRVHQRTELKLEGAIESIDLTNKTLTVLGVNFTVDDQTKMRDESDTGIRFFDLTNVAVGDFVEVKGFVDSNGVNFATKLERKNENANTDRELKGTVSNINTTDFNFTLVDVAINTTDTTIFEDINGDNASQSVFFAQLVDGMRIEVKGSVTNGVFTASKVKIEENEGDNGGNDNGGGDNGSHRTEFRGTIESLAGTSFVVSGNTVNITDTTKYEVNEAMLAADQFWALAKVGDQVKVKGSKDANNVITAKKIALEIEHQGNVAEVELVDSGSLVGDVLMVGNHNVQFDANTDFKSMSTELSQAEFLAQATQWTKFMVEGTLRDDVIFARKVKQPSSDENNQIKVSAFIEAFIDNGLTVALHEIAFSTNTEYFKGDNSLTHDEFIAQAQLNDKIIIKGSITNGNQEVISATSVELKMHN
ncbi:MAG: hypothetical protein JKX78_13930 [Alteromonadaceae bacterium]|nr:hypothetical protein [Alteromonadaceae bacterium]